MLNAPTISPYDLRFQVVGFPVRIAWTFWLMGALLGWNWSQGLDQMAASRGIDTPGAAVLLILWILCVLLTILIHELGHAFAWRHFGQNVQIVLYHFGGLAINDSFTSWDGGRRRRVSAGEQLIVSAAGPIAQLTLALVVWLVGLGVGMPVMLAGWSNAWGWQLPMGEPPSTIALYGVFDALIWTSVFWAILNLAPILPLDGGQILYNAMLLFDVGQPQRTAHLVSVAVGGLLGIGFLTSGFAMGGILFLMLAVSNWQQMQQGAGILNAKPVV